MDNYTKWENLFKEQQFSSFNANKNALLWLKVKAISRNEQLESFVTQNEIALRDVGVKARSKELFSILESNLDESTSKLDSFLKDRSNAWYVSKGVNESQLKRDLYEISSYCWGGDQNNSLDKYFVNHYVKMISSYCLLSSHCDDIARNAWNYVQVSWYNNWTSFLIESIFNRNPLVVPAVGEIKSVDFFILDHPLDLKVTFFPNKYLEIKLKEIYGKGELSWLKGKAKERGVTCPQGFPSSKQLMVLQEILSVEGFGDVISEMRSNRSRVVNEAKSNPTELIRWLYENQGEGRFGAENRLFLILADLDSMEDSWKLKRAFATLEESINAYLSEFSIDRLKQIDFSFNSKNYTALSDAIFVLKHSETSNS